MNPSSEREPKQEEYAPSETSGYCSPYEDHGTASEIDSECNFDNGSPSENRAGNGQLPIDDLRRININDFPGNNPVEIMGDFSHQDTDQNIAVLPQAEHIRGDTSNNPDASTNNNPNASASGPPAQAAIIEANIEVDVSNCKHSLANVTYNDREDFSDALDNIHTGKNSMDLIKSLLKNEDVCHIWSECHGGSDPPLNLLFHLAGKKCDLAGLRKYAELDRRNRFGDLIKLINGYKSFEETRLDKLDFNLLAEISKLIRVQPYPTVLQSRPLWKTLAGIAGLDNTTINNLDGTGNREPQSLAMVFIQYVSQTYPDEKVAWLAKGLKDIGINSLLKNDDLNIFQQCKDKGCIVILKPKDKK